MVGATTLSKKFRAHISFHKHNPSNFDHTMINIVTFLFALFLAAANSMEIGSNPGLNGPPPKRSPNLNNSLLPTLQPTVQPSQHGPSKPTRLPPRRPPPPPPMQRNSSFSIKMNTTQPTGQPTPEPTNSAVGSSHLPGREGIDDDMSYAYYYYYSNSTNDEDYHNITYDDNNGIVKQQPSYPLVVRGSNYTDNFDDIGNTTNTAVKHNTTSLATVDKSDIPSLPYTSWVVGIAMMGAAGLLVAVAMPKLSMLSNTTTADANTNVKNTDRRHIFKTRTPLRREKVKELLDESNSEKVTMLSSRIQYDPESSIYF